MDFSPVPSRVCLISTSSASASSPQSLVSSTHSAVNSSAKCECQATIPNLVSVAIALLTPLFRYWGTSETLLPVYQSVDKAIAKHTDVDHVVNFASSRSVYQSTMELMEFPQIKSIAIIAEGVPERVSPTLQNM